MAGKVNVDPGLIPLKCGPLIGPSHALVQSSKITESYLKLTDYELTIIQLQQQLDQKSLENQLLRQENDAKQAELSEQIESRMEIETALSLKLKQLSLTIVEEEKKRVEAEMIANDLEERLSKVRRESRVMNETLQEEIQGMKDEIQDYKRQKLTSESQVIHLTGKLDESEIKNNQLIKVIEDLTKEKLLLEEKFLSLPLTNASRSPPSTIDLDEATDAPTAHSRTLIRNLQERLAQTVADFRIQSMKLLDTERTLRDLQQDKEIGDRLRIKLESQMETTNHQITLWEEKVENLTREVKVWQTRHNDATAEVHQLEVNLEEVMLKLNHSATVIEELKVVQKKTRQDYEHKITLLNEQIVSLKNLGDQKNFLESSTVDLKEKLLLQQQEAEKAMQAAQDMWEEQLMTLTLAFEKRGDTLRELETQNTLKTSQISFLTSDLSRKEKEINELRTSLAEYKRLNQSLSKSANLSDSKGAIISELRANLVDRDRLVHSIEEQKSSLAETKKSTETIVSELKNLKREHAELLEKYQEALDTIEELSTTAAEEIDSREAELITLRATVKEQLRWKKKLEELSDAYDSLLKQHSEVVDERSAYPASAFHQIH